MYSDGTEIRIGDRLVGGGCVMGFGKDGVLVVDVRVQSSERGGYALPVLTYNMVAVEFCKKQS